MGAKQRFLVVALGLACSLPTHATMPRPLEQCCLEMAQGVAAESNPNCPKPPPDRVQCEAIAAGWYAYAARPEQGQQGGEPSPATPKPTPPAPPVAPPAPPVTQPVPALDWGEHIRQHPQGAALTLLPLLLALGLMAAFWRRLDGGSKGMMLSLAFFVPPQFHIAWIELQALPNGVQAGAREGFAMLFIWVLHGLWLGLLGLSLAGALGLVFERKGPGRWYGGLALTACLVSGIQAWQIIPIRI